MPSNGQAIVFENVVKRYPGPRGEIAAIAGIDLTVESGEVFGLLGPNGAGKTTSIEILVGLRRPTEGKVRVLGLDPVKRRDEVRKCVAIQPQHAAVFEQQTVAELLRAWASFYPDPDDPEVIITRMGLQDSRDVRVAKLSGGQRQRLLVGTALISRPRVLVLDEPSTGMDPNARQELWDAIRGYRASGGTVLLSTHSMEEAEQLCDRVSILHAGSVVACGSPEALIAEHAPEQELNFMVPAGSDLAELGSHPEVLQLTTHHDGGYTRVLVRTTNADSILGMLTGPLAARKIHIRDAGLEAVFRRLTGTSFDATGTDPGDLTPSNAETGSVESISMGGVAP